MVYHDIVLMNFKNIDVLLSWFLGQHVTEFNIGWNGNKSLFSSKNISLKVYFLKNLFFSHLKFITI